jgi:chemotaxis protein MotA
MFAIIGIVVVLGCVIGGFILEGGHLPVLMQPIELLIIGGSALGSFLISAPKTLIIFTFKSLMKVFTGKEMGKAEFMEILSAMYELMSLLRSGGPVAIDQHVNKPESSSVLGKYKALNHHKELLHFICDNFKVLLAGNIEPHQFDAMMNIDIATKHHHALTPSQAVNKVSDSMPGLGIVAAVLGIVLTMGKINEPPEVLGHSIGAALVGTFLGILLCYGFFGPMATNLEHQANEHHAALKAIRAGLANYSAGVAPIVAVEAARRAIPANAQPTFEELEEGMRSVK